MRKDRDAAWKKRHRQWLGFVEGAIDAVEAGKKIPLGPAAKPRHAPESPLAKGNPLRVVICSPHADDEALVGGLPLRLRRELGARVTNVAITLGSDLSQRRRRLRELRSSCAALGFRPVVASSPAGFDDVHLATRWNRPQEWAKMVRTLSTLFEKERPDVVFVHHAGDENVTHVATHQLVGEALRAYLKRMGRAPLPVIEMEFWHQLASPNLMVGISPDDEATLIMATAEHGGEVRRNPYHLRHPARMMDNVRRGAEVVGKAGGAAPDFPFAELYRFTFLSAKGWAEPRRDGCILGPDEKLDWYELVAHFAAKA